MHGRDSPQDVPVKRAIVSGTVQLKSSQREVLTENPLRRTLSNSTAERCGKRQKSILWTQRHPSRSAAALDEPFGQVQEPNDKWIKFYDKIIQTKLSSPRERLALRTFRFSLRILAQLAPKRSEFSPFLFRTKVELQNRSWTRNSSSSFLLMGSFGSNDSLWADRRTSPWKS